VVIFGDVTGAVGRTPLVELGRLAAGLPGRVVAKLESANPCGSVKDRVGVAMIDDAERRGVLRPGMTLVEPTGGNTGIGLAFAAAVRGYRLVLTMPETMSTERVALLRYLGARVVLTGGILMGDAVAEARRLVHEIPDAVMLDQFSNPANPDLHRRTTAIEIWDDTDGRVDMFVSAVGTGGTITGVGEVLKARKPSVRVVAVEPAGAAVLSGQPAGEHQIPGIGVGFIPQVLNRSIVDDVVAVSDLDAFATARRLARQEGILAGVSSGAAAHTALASAPEAAGKMIVVLLPDTGERYLTTMLMSVADSTADATGLSAKAAHPSGEPPVMR
jgi:cysteine synthase A